ncbi:MAG: hypothetical protein WAL71_06080 [Terriglobales bacterium]
MKQILRNALFFFLAALAIAAFSTMALAQKFDVAAGISSIDAPGSAVANNINHQPLSLTGGAYLSFSGDYIFHKNIGVEGEFVRRQTEGYDDAIDLDYRPIFYDANAIWRKRFYKRFSAELEGGLGMETTRIYTGGCGSSNCYVNKNHLMGDAGAGVKIYPLQRGILGHFFIRPEGRFYVIRNNQEFSSDHAIRYGASIGYSFK